MWQESVTHKEWDAAVNQIPVVKNSTAKIFFSSHSKPQMLKMESRMNMQNWRKISSAPGISTY